MRKGSALDPLRNFLKKVSKNFKNFRKRINFTNLVLKNGETMPFSIVKRLLFLLS